MLSITKSQEDELNDKKRERYKASQERRHTDVHGTSTHIVYVLLHAGAQAACPRGRGGGDTTEWIVKRRWMGLIKNKIEIFINKRKRKHTWKITVKTKKEKRTTGEKIRGEYVDNTTCFFFLSYFLLQRGRGYHYITPLHTYAVNKLYLQPLAPALPSSSSPLSCPAPRLKPTRLTPSPRSALPCHKFPVLCCNVPQWIAWFYWLYCTVYYSKNSFFL